MEPKLSSHSWLLKVDGLKGIRMLSPVMRAPEERGATLELANEPRASPSSGWAYRSSVPQPGRSESTYWFEAYLLVCKVLEEPWVEGAV